MKGLDRSLLIYRGGSRWIVLLAEFCCHVYVDSQAGEELHVSQTSAQSEAVFFDFCHKTLEIDIRPDDISIRHRLRKRPNMKTRPFIIRFASRKARSTVCQAKKETKFTGMPREANLY